MCIGRGAGSQGDFREIGRKVEMCEMATKSKELLSCSAMEAAERLKKGGWHQKEYLSAGVIALDRADTHEKLLCKQLALGEATDKIEEIVRAFGRMSADEQGEAVLMLRKERCLGVAE